MKIPLPTLIRRTGQLILVLSIATLLGMGWYGYKRGFTRRWRESVFTEFRRHGIEITFRQLTLDPFRGLVARDVTLFDTTDRRRTIAQIDQAVLNVDLTRLARGRPFLTALELRDTRLSLPLSANGDATKRLEVQNLSARLYFPNKQVQLTQATAKVLGCRVRAQGWIANPNALQENSEDGHSTLLQTARAVVEELQSLTPKGETPLIRIQFSGDMLKPESIRANIQISAEDFGLRNYPIETLECTATWRENALELTDLFLEDAKGHLRASGRWDPPHKTMDFQIESTLDLTQTARALGFTSALQSVVFKERPSLQIHLHSEPSTPYRLTAFLSAQNFSQNGEPFEKASAHASYQPGQWSIRELQLKHRTGSLSADLLSTPEQLRISLTSNLPMDVLNNTTPSNLPLPFSLLAALRSEHPTPLEIKISGPGPALSLASGSGTLHLRNGSANGIPVEEARTVIQLAGGLLQLTTNSAKVLGGTATLSAELSMNPAQPTLKATLELSNLQFGAVGRLFSPGLESDGIFSGAIEWTGRTGTFSKTNGRGHFTVADGNLLALKSIAPLIQLSKSVLPEISKSTKQQGSVSFELQNGIAQTSDLQIESNEFSIESRGRVSLAEETIELTGRASLRAHPEKGMEFSAEGAAQKPRWRPKATK